MIMMICCFISLMGLKKKHDLVRKKIKILDTYYLHVTFPKQK